MTKRKKLRSDQTTTAKILAPVLNRRGVFHVSNLPGVTKEEAFEEWEDAIAHAAMDLGVSSRSLIEQAAARFDHGDLVAIEVGIEGFDVYLLHRTGQSFICGAGKCDQC